MRREGGLVNQKQQGAKQQGRFYGVLSLCLCLMALCHFSCSCGSEDPQEFSVSEGVVGEGGRFDRSDAGKVKTDGSEVSVEASSEHVTEKEEETRPEVKGDIGREAGASNERRDGGEPDVLSKQAYRFRVVSQAEDTVPPKLDKIVFGAKRYRAGEFIEVFITPQADLSGVVSAQVSVKSPKQKHSLYLSTVYHPGRQAFVGRARLPSYVEAGAWTIDRVYLSDAVGNPSVFLGNKAPLQGSGFFVENKNADVTAPSVTAFSLLAKTAKAKESLGFWLKVNEAGTGVERVSVELEGPKQRRLTATAIFHPVRLRYEGWWRFPSDVENGTWTVTRVDVSDRAENRGFLDNQSALLKAQTVVISDGVPQPPPSGKDKVPPQVLGLWLTPGPVDSGTQIQMWVDAEDPGQSASGVRSVRASFSEPSGANVLSMDLWFNPALGLWEGSQRIPRFARGGVWSLSTLSVRDRAGNQQQLQRTSIQKLSTLSRERWSSLQATTAHLGVVLRQATGTTDRLGPRLRGLQVAVPEVKLAVGQEQGFARLYARVEDLGGSGVNAASCTFQGTQPYETKQVLLESNVDTGFFEGNLVFRRGDSPGVWWISGCFLRDKLGNTRSVPGTAIARLPRLDISRITQAIGKNAYSVTFSLASSGVSDNDAPEMKSFHIVPGAVPAGGLVRFFAKASDRGRAGLQGGACRFRALQPLGLANSLSIPLSWNPATGFWEGEGRLSRDATPGTWVIDSCLWRDKASNLKAYDAKALSALPALAPAGLAIPLPREHRSFVVTSIPPAPKTGPAPLFSAVSLSSSQSKAGQTIRLYLEAKVQQGGTPLSLLQGSCALKPSVFEAPNEPYASIRLSFSALTGWFEGQWTFDSRRFSGVWSLSRCTLSEPSGRRFKVEDDILRKLKKIDLSQVKKKYNKNLVADVTEVSQPPVEKVKPIVATLRWLPKAEAKAGAALVLAIEASDKDSGIASVSASLESPTGQDSAFVDCRLNLATKRWQGVMRLGPNVENGTWRWRSLRVVDRAGNTLILDGAAPLLTGKGVVVRGGVPLSDKAPPVLTKLSSSTRLVLAGQPIRFAAKLSDAESGVRNASLVFASPTAKAQMRVSFAWNPATQLWEGQGRVPLYGEDGVWKVSSFSATDFVGRQLSLSSSSPLLKGLSVQVRASQRPKDQTPPRLLSIHLSPPRLRAGEAIAVVADASDADSGIRSLRAFLESSTAGSLWFSLRPNVFSGLYESTGRLPLSAKGKWRLSRVQIVDNAGNRREYDDKDSILQ